MEYKPTKLIQPEKRKRRRTAYVFITASPKGRPWDSLKPIELLKKHGLKPKIQGSVLTGFSRVLVDGGYMSLETLTSIIGKTYTSIQKIKLYAYPEQKEMIEKIIKACGVDLLDEWPFGY